LPGPVEGGAGGLAPGVPASQETLSDRERGLAPRTPRLTRMGFLSRLLNRPGAQADKRVGWFDRAQADLDRHADEFASLDDDALAEAARTVFETGGREEQLVRYAALVREAAERAVGERPYDTQLRGLIGLLDGTVVQMLTGEGKTLVGALAAAGYALQGRR